MDVDQYIAELHSPMKEIADLLRNIIRGASSDISESIKWNVPVFSVNRNICSVIAHKSHVNLQIFQGAHIADANILSGTGVDMRHLKFGSTVDVDRDQILRCLEQAIVLDSK